MDNLQSQQSTPLVSRQPGQADTLVHVGSVVFGGKTVVLIGGPCAVEDAQQMHDTAQTVAEAGGHMLRGGAWKPRTSPYAFQGLGHPGLELLHNAGKTAGLPIVTEVLDPRDVEAVAGVADMLQIGSRSIQNFPLLREAGAAGKPVLLKRGMMTTIDEWLNAAEYVLAAGCRDLVFCERGIRTFEPAMRNTMDVSAVVILKERTHLPVIVDPSHAAGDNRYVLALAKAAIAAGADGLLVESHCTPETARSDSDQALDAVQFRELSEACRAVARAVERDL